MYDFDYLNKFRQMQDEKVMQIMTVCGPYSTRNNLQYDPLKNIMQKVK